MLTPNDINILQCCVSNYIENAKTQLDSLTIGKANCADLAEFYEGKINECYEVLKKLNSHDTQLNMLNSIQNELSSIESIIESIVEKIILKQQAA